MKKKPKRLRRNMVNAPLYCLARKLVDGDMIFSSVGLIVRVGKETYLIESVSKRKPRT